MFLFYFNFIHFYKKLKKLKKINLKILKNQVKVFLTNQLGLSGLGAG